MRAKDKLPFVVMKGEEHYDELHKLYEEGKIEKSVCYLFVKYKRKRWTFQWFNGAIAFLRV